MTPETLTPADVLANAAPTGEAPGPLMDIATRGGPMWSVDNLVAWLKLGRWEPLANLSLNQASQLADEVCERGRYLEVLKLCNAIAGSDVADSTCRIMEAFTFLLGSSESEAAQ